MANSGSFRKGDNRPRKPKGAISAKTRQWEALGDSIATTHTERFNKILASSKDEQFVSLYLQTLEYFKPKLGRTEHTGKDGEALPAPVITLAHAKPQRQAD